MRDKKGPVKTRDLLLRRPSWPLHRVVRRGHLPVAQRALGSIEVLGLNTLEELVLAMIRTESS